jgi:hypothetical protein
MNLYDSAKSGTTVLALVLVACGGDSGSGGAAADSAEFARLQERGAAVMGVDQYTSAHVFEDLPDGGRIVLDRADSSDTASIATIRSHMRDIAAAFRSGDFAKPFQVHAQEVPGTRVMAERRALISYEASDRPRGAQVRITSRDSAAVAAVHQFLAFQRSDHRAAGHDTAGGGHAHGGRGG